MIDWSSFRDALSRLVGAVTVITTEGPAGPGGYTASAVCSVADDPPMLLAGTNRMSRQHAAFNANGVRCVNVLSAAQERVSRTFASAATVAERFQGERRIVLEAAAPALDTALVNFDARVA